MHNRFNHQARQRQPSGYIDFPNISVNVDEIDVVGNWNKPDQFLVYLKKGELFNTGVRPDKGLLMYLEALTNQTYIDHENFTGCAEGYYRAGTSGLIIVPDENNTILAVLAQHVESVEDIGKQKQKKIKMRTTYRGTDFRADCTKDEFNALFKRARLGEHVALWPEQWPYAMPNLSSMGVKMHGKKSIVMK